MLFLFGFDFVIGITIGIAIVVGFVQLQNSRSNRRFELATTVAAFAQMSREDYEKLLQDQYPSWLVFSEPQKLTWFNRLLGKIWPFVDEASSDLIMKIVESVLEQHKSEILASLKVSKLTIGTIPPIFTGVSIIEEGSEEGVITMELKMQWDGNPDIIMDVETDLGMKQSVEVKHVGVTIVFRLIFKLVDEFPCFGGVSFSLTEKKRLDFKVIGRSKLSIPGITDAIDAAIRDAVQALETRGKLQE